jgi:methionyl aminopeptidase
MQEVLSSATRQANAITYYGPDAFEGMRKAGRLAAECLDALYEMVEPGVTTQAIDEFIFNFGVSRGAIPATLNYRGYRKSSCTSITHVVCHGIPNDKPLRDGDIVNIDVTFLLDGWHGDSSRMYAAGELKRAAERLIEVTYECLMRGVEAIHPGGRMGDIGHAIQTHAEAAGYSVVREYCGHGIGQQMHEGPEVLHVGQRGMGMKLKPGMVFTIEPMINQGGRGTRTLKDGWTVITRDHSLSAQWEHTVAVTEDGFEVLTLREEERRS